MSSPTIGINSPRPATACRLLTQAETFHDDVMQDTLLIRRIAVSDTQAFDHLYRKYKPRLERYLFKHLHEASAVEEACNDVMVVVWMKASQFRTTSKVSTWIFGIARIEVRRVCGRSITGPNKPTPNNDSDATVPATETIFDWQEHVETLAQAVAALPLMLRTPIVLSYYHDYSYAQIATYINCSKSTVKSRLRLARRRLKTILTRANHQFPDEV